MLRSSPPDQVNVLWAAGKDRVHAGYYARSFELRSRPEVGGIEIRIGDGDICDECGDIRACCESADLLSTRGGDLGLAVLQCARRKCCFGGQSAIHVETRERHRAKARDRECHRARIERDRKRCDAGTRWWDERSIHAALKSVRKYRRREGEACRWLRKA
jgi:hypothetical protein